MRFGGSLLPAISGDALELNELVIRFRFKRRYHYLWLAISRITHQVIGFCIGACSTQTLKAFWRSVPCDYRRKLVYTDFYHACEEHFKAWQHRPCDKGSGKTSAVEGLNNKWRNCVLGLVRKTVCARYLEDLEKRLWLVIENHNRNQIKNFQKLIASTQ